MDFKKAIFSELLVDAVNIVDAEKMANRTKLFTILTNTILETTTQTYSLAFSNFEIAIAMVYRNGGGSGGCYYA